MEYQFEDTRMQCFEVPTRVADLYLKIATGAQLKVLLYLLRFDRLTGTSEGIAEYCNLKPDEVDDAVRFWIKERVLVMEQGRLRLVSAVKTVQQKELPRVLTTVILEETDEGFRAMIGEIQRIVGKPINSSTLNVFYNMTANLGFPPEVVVQLAAYCNSIGKFTMRYLETVAIDWHDEGINTFELAEEKIRRLETGRSVENNLKRVFGIATNFSASQKEFIRTWMSWGVTEELIVEAYNRCMDNKGKMSFSYMNKILENWNKAGFKKPADIREGASTDRKQHTGLSQLEQAMINKMQTGGNNQ